MTEPDRTVTFDDVCRVARWCGREALRGTLHAALLGATLGALVGLGRSYPAIPVVVGLCWGLFLGPAFGLARGWLNLAAEWRGGRFQVAQRSMMAGGRAGVGIALPFGLWALINGVDAQPVLLMLLAAGGFGAVLGWIIAITVLDGLGAKPAPADEAFG